jgi:hypothetical protein
MTAMPSAPAANAIAFRIREILARGADLSPEVMRFIDSTFSDPSADDLAAVLGADADSERDSLLELLFSPDESLQLDLEDLLATTAPLDLDEDRVVESLCRPTLSVAFHLPGNRGVVSVAMTPLLARRFVHHLRINRSIPEPLAAAVAARLTGRERQRLRVLIRGARFDFSASRTDFLRRLIEQLGFEDQADWASFAYALEVLTEFEHTTDICHALEERKKLLIKALYHGRQLREQLAAANIETLLSRGQRLTWVDEDAVRRQLLYIDRVCLAAFGRIAHLDPCGPEETVAFSGLPDITDFMRRLT